MLARPTRIMTARLARWTPVARRVRAALATLLVGLAAVALVGSTAASSALAQATSIFQATLLEPNQKTAEVSTDELRQILQDQSALVPDARPHLEFAVSHIPGTVNVAPKPGVPMSLYVSDVAEIERLAPDKTAPIVLYCNGPFCGKSKRLGEELLEAGYTNVRRYQLGAPVWRALIGVMQIEPDGVRYVRDRDRTAWFVDARPPEEFAAGTLTGAQNVPPGAVNAAKDDGRLPMEDHDTRIVVFGASAERARAVTAELAKNAFHNVSYFDGTLDDLLAALGEAPVVATR